MPGELDITKNIKTIEGFKSQLLTGVAELFESMVDGSATTKERAEILSDILIVTYLLSDKLGISYNTLDLKVLSRIKVGILEEKGTTEWKTALSLLGRHIDKNRSID